MPKKILLVDDEQAIVDLLGAMLAQNGYEVVTALSGKSCLKKASENKPDLIILDVLMPDVDGFEVCKLLKEDETTKNIPVIMLTSRLVGYICAVSIPLATVR